MAHMQLPVVHLPRAPNSRSSSTMITAATSASLPPRSRPPPLVRPKKVAQIVPAGTLRSMPNADAENEAGRDADDSPPAKKARLADRRQHKPPTKPLGLHEPVVASRAIRAEVTRILRKLGKNSSARERVALQVKANLARIADAARAAVATKAAATPAAGESGGESGPSNTKCPADTGSSDQNLEKIYNFHRTAIDNSGGHPSSTSTSSTVSSPAAAPPALTTGATPTDSTSTIAPTGKRRRRGSDDAGAGPNQTQHSRVTPATAVLLAALCSAEPLPAADTFRNQVLISIWGTVWDIDSDPAATSTAGERRVAVMRRLHAVTSPALWERQWIRCLTFLPCGSAIIAEHAAAAAAKVTGPSAPAATLAAATHHRRAPGSGASSPVAPCHASLPAADVLSLLLDQSAAVVRRFWSQAELDAVTQARMATAAAGALSANASIASKVGGRVLAEEVSSGTEGWDDQQQQVQVQVQVQERKTTKQQQQRQQQQQQQHSGKFHHPTAAAIASWSSSTATSRLGAFFTELDKKVVKLLTSATKQASATSAASASVALRPVLQDALVIQRWRELVQCTPCSKALLPAAKVRLLLRVVGRYANLRPLY